MSDPVSANFAITAYRSAGGPGAAEAGGDPLSGFGAALRQAMDGAVEISHRADAASAQALGGQGNVTDVVLAVSKAELSLQTTVALRDKMVSAYQDIMRMPI